MRHKMILLSINIGLLILLFTTSISAAPYTIRFGGEGPGNILGYPISGNPVVTSKSNQPRNVTGSNPHQGVDLRAVSGTEVRAICSGWVTSQNATSTYDLIFECDVNGDGLKNDNLQIFYDHLSAVGFVANNTFIASGTKVAESGSEGGKTDPHLHFGPRTDRLGTKVWVRAEPYYNWNNSYNYGRDMDFISTVSWSNNVAKIVAYDMSLGIKNSLNSNSATLYHRIDGTSTWSSVQMVKSGDYYSYDFSKAYSNLQVINWMVRVDNPNTSATYKSAFMIPKYEQPSTNPNGTTNNYDYYKCTIVSAGGGCNAIVTP
ncbi:M23 family metallopeptidase [Paenibacillus paeoniae]|uniref:M23 family metallopeptidase n=1 Tax=Paenibacillus paeoniae TaxID=2292705 RepID=UPI0014021F20|nr:M23 family metallopeptidase [Paenibacillus paeoniae]